MIALIFLINYGKYLCASLRAAAFQREQENADVDLNLFWLRGCLPPTIHLVCILQEFSISQPFTLNYSLEHTSVVKNILIMPIGVKIVT